MPRNCKGYIEKGGVKPSIGPIQFKRGKGKEALPRPFLNIKKRSLIQKDFTSVLIINVLSVIIIHNLKYNHICSNISPQSLFCDTQTV
jgi:hypothetical protein